MRIRMIRRATSCDGPVVDVPRRQRMSDYQFWKNSSPALFHALELKRSNTALPRYGRSSNIVYHGWKCTGMQDRKQCIVLQERNQHQTPFHAVDARKEVL